jgi:hypothetical protein
MVFKFIETKIRFFVNLPNYEEKCNTLGLLILSKIKENNFSCIEALD